MLLNFFLLLGMINVFIYASALKCPEGSVPTFGNKTICYTWSKNEFLHFDQAEIECNKKSGHLVTILNQKENDYLNDIIDHNSGYYWIGLSNNNGKWEWEDGSPVNYVNWRDGEPTKHCGTFTMDGHGGWAAIECDISDIDYICLIPAV